MLLRSRSGIGVLVHLCNRFTRSSALWTGWIQLRVQTNPSYVDDVQMFGAGYIEGALSAGRIFEMYTNMMPVMFSPQSNLTLARAHARVESGREEGSVCACERERDGLTACGCRYVCACV